MNETPKDIARLLAKDVEAVCRELLPNGKKVGNDWVTGDVNDGAGTSLKVCLKGDKAGKWADFSGEERGDLLGLWHSVRGISMGLAMKQSKQFLNLTDAQPYNQPTKTYQRPVKQKSWRSTKTVEDKPDTPVMAYLKSRGLTEETIKAFRVCETYENPFSNELPNNPGTIVYPSLRVHDEGTTELISVKYLALERTKRADGSEQKHTRPSGAGYEPILFGWQALDQTTRKVAISEGETDCLSLHQYGIPTLSVPFGGGGGKKQQWVETEFPYLERFDDIYLCLDNDKSGHEAVLELVERLGRHRCLVVKLPYKDANECLMKGVTVQEIAQCFKDAKPIAPAELKNAWDFRDKVRALNNQQLQQTIGLSLPWPFTQGLDKFSFLPGQMTVWSGYSGHGKTTMLSYQMVHAISQGEIACVASLEVSGDRTVNKLAKQITCKSMMSDAEIDSALIWLGDRLWIYDYLDYEDMAKLDEMLDVFLYARRRYGVTQFVVDSLMMLTTKEDDYNMQAMVTKKLLGFAKTHRCHLHLVIHPRKSKETYQRPGIGDVKGIGTQTDAVHNVLLVWANRKKMDAQREFEINGTAVPMDLAGEPDAILKIEKNRETGWLASIPLWFDAPSGQYLSNASPHHPQGMPKIYATTPDPSVVEDDWTR